MIRLFSCLLSSINITSFAFVINSHRTLFRPEHLSPFPQPRGTSRLTSTFKQLDLDQADSEQLDPAQCEKFVLKVCASTSCTQKRRALGMDDLDTFVSLYERKESARAPDVQIEESTCLGACKRAPCVAVEHEDYIGRVCLEGMTDEEIALKLFPK